MNKNISNKTKNIFLCVIVFVVYLYMAYCVPYMDDDWLNGGADGWYIAMSGITNGRYFGNFIICILVRNKIVKVLVMSIVIWSISFIISYYGFNIKTSIFGYKFLVINILLMLINISIWNEVFGWVTGFSVYSCSVLFLIIYMYINKDIINNDNIIGNHKKLFLYFLYFVFSIIIQLFLENISIGITIISTLVLLYSLKFRINRLKHFLIFVGNIIGTIIIFSCNMISEVASEGYSVDERALSFNINDSLISIILHMIYRFFSKVWFDVWNYNYIISVVFIALIILILFDRINENKYFLYFISFSIVNLLILTIRFVFVLLDDYGLINNDLIYALTVIIVSFVSCYLLIKYYIYKSYLSFNKITSYIYIIFLFLIGIFICFSKLLFGVSFFIYTLLIMYIAINNRKNTEWKIILFSLLLCIMCNAPLAAVVDDSPRLVIHSTVLLILCISVFINCIYNKYKEVNNNLLNNDKLFKIIFSLLSCALLLTYIIILIPLSKEHFVYKELENQIAVVKESGSKELRISDYEDKSRLYMKKLDGKIIYNFYNYYDIDLDVALYIDDEMIYNGNEEELNKSRY